MNKRQRKKHAKKMNGLLSFLLWAVSKSITYSTNQEFEKVFIENIDDMLA